MDGSKIRFCRGHRKRGIRKPGGDVNCKKCRSGGVPSGGVPRIFFLLVGVVFGWGACCFAAGLCLASPVEAAPLKVCCLRFVVPSSLPLPAGLLLAGST